MNSTCKIMWLNIHACLLLYTFLKVIKYKYESLLDISEKLYKQNYLND